MGPTKQLLRSILADDVATVCRLLDDHLDLRQQLNEGVFDWNMPPLAAAKSVAMADLLMANGALVATVSKWWAPGFGVGQVEPKIAQLLVQRGAQLTIHAAVGIGLIDVVQEMLDREPELAHRRGGDGCHPLHFCLDREMATLLIGHGAEIDARDEDHASTPAQWRIGDSEDLVRFLLAKGAKADVFMAAALGDLDLAKELVAEDPRCTTYRIGHNNGPFPGIGFQERGGSIYQWSLGFNLSPHEVAVQRGYAGVYDFLLEHTPPRAKFLVACTSANRPLATAMAQDHPDIVKSLDDEDLALLAKYCWETNKSIEAVELMLDLGFPVETPEFNHGYTPLHNAAWCGDPDLVRLLIERGHPMDVRDPDYDSTPIGWAVHSCLEAKRHPEGHFSDVVRMLLDNGTPFDPQHYPVGHEGIDAVIKAHLDRQS